MKKEKEFNVKDFLPEGARVSNKVLDYIWSSGFVYGWNEAMNACKAVDKRRKNG